MFEVDNKDYFKGYGYVRLCVMKQERENSWNNGITVLHSDHFEHDKLISDNKSFNWISEELENTDWVEWFLKDKPLGFYEILGRFYYHAWETGYEHVEWESEWELRHIKWKQISYDDAENLDDNEILKDSGVELGGYQHVSPFMSEFQILLEYAKFLQAEGKVRGSLESLSEWFNNLPDDARNKEEIASLMMERQILVGSGFQSEVVGETRRCSS